MRSDLQTITAASPSTPPAPIDPDLSGKVRALRGRIMVVEGRATWASPVEIGPKTRGALAARLDQLNADLSRHSPATVLRAILKLLSVMKLPSGGSEIGAAKVAEEYAATLSELPAWAVVEACERVKRGKAGHDVFAPTTAELYRMAEEVAEPFRRERRQISEILAAKPLENAVGPSVEARAKIAGGLERLRSDLAVSAARAAMEDRLRKPASGLADGPKVST